MREVRDLNADIQYQWIWSEDKEDGRHESRMASRERLPAPHPVEGGKWWEMEVRLMWWHSEGQEFGNAFTSTSMLSDEDAFEVALAHVVDWQAASKVEA